MVSIYKSERKKDIFNYKRKVLHTAPESNLKVELDKNKEMEYLCGDLYPPEGKGIIKLDVTDLPFKDSYFERLKETGFHVELYNYRKEHGSDHADKYGLLKDENIFICKKMA